MEKHLHIIAFDIPYPVNNGRAMDIFHCISALQSVGIQIHLHCFRNEKIEQKSLHAYCASVHYYDGNHGHKGFSTSLPFIVSSRKSEQLFQNLLKDNYPILMEDIHCTYLLNDERFSSRKCFVRLHYVGFDYYSALQKSASSFLKKLYYWNESRLLKKYEKRIALKATFIVVKHADKVTYQKEFTCPLIFEIDPFISFQEVKSAEGMGSYCFFHGDLSIDANEQAAIWLIKKVFNEIKVPLVISGRNPSNKLIELSHLNNHTCIVPNPNERELQDMIVKAHIQLVPSFIDTGLKIKLLNALYNGKHCVANDIAVAGSGLESACHIGSNANAFKEIIVQLYHQPFTVDEIGLREKLLLTRFDNRRNALLLAKMIFDN